MNTRLGRALAARAADARRRALLAVLRDPPPDARLRDLLEAVVGTPYEAILASLTIGEIAGATTPLSERRPEPNRGGPPSEPVPEGRRVRTRAEKLGLDTAVLDVLRAAPEGLDLPSLAERVQATEPQARASVERLLERDRILVGGSPEVPIHRAR